MPALVTDQFRIQNASNFVESITDPTNSYYVFVGLCNPEIVGFGRSDTWNSDTPPPIDNINFLNHYESTAIFGRKITAENVRRVIRRIDWISGRTYEIYRPDYDDSNRSPITGSLRLYDTSYYVINSNFRVYICIDNGSTGDNIQGNASVIEPNFTDLEPVVLSDGYTWKYLYTVSPSDIIKFDTTDFISVPNNWSTSTDPAISAVRENGNSALNDNQIKNVFIENSGLGIYGGLDGQSRDIVGDGEGGRVTISVNPTDLSIADVVVTAGGKNYTYGLIDLGTTLNPGQNACELIPIIPPSKGHGFDIYEELGADRVLIYARFDDSTPDFPIDTKYAQVGILKNPTIFDPTGVDDTIYTDDTFTATSSMIFSGFPLNPPAVGSVIEQEVSGGIAKAYVASYDETTAVLKYVRDRSLYFNGGNGTNQEDYVGINQFFGPDGKFLEFDSNNPITSDNGFSAQVDGSFNGSSTTNSAGRTVGLGVNFTAGFANPEINNKSGEIIYIDNRPEVSRNSRQKEDVKIILEF